MRTDEIFEQENSYSDPVIGQTTLPQLFERSVQRYGDNTAQRYKGRPNRSLTPDPLPEAPNNEYDSLTYEAMGDIVRTLSFGFQELGVEPGERIGLFANTRMEWVQADFALLGCGAVITTVYTESSPDEAQYLLDDSGSTGVVVENRPLLDRILSIEDELDLSFIVSIDDVSTDRDDVYTLKDVHELGRKNTKDHWIEPTLDVDDLASLVYTSGTTGQPKGGSSDPSQFSVDC